MNVSFAAVLSLLVLAVLLSVAESAKVESASRRSLAVTTEDVELTVHYDDPYPSSNSVSLSYTIVNKSASPIKRFQADSMMDVTILLTDPSGQTMTRFKDQEGALIQRINRRFFVEEIPPMGKSEGRVHLAIEYPISVAGEYRCVFTKRVYIKDAAIVPKVSSDPPGRPLDLSTPEFRFTVQKIDPSFKSPLADILVVKEGVLTQGGVAVENAPKIEGDAKDALNKLKDRLNQNRSEAPAPSAVPEKAEPQPVHSKSNWGLWISLFAVLAVALWGALKKSK